MGKKIEMEKIEQKVNYLLSSNNDACYDKYLELSIKCPSF